MSVALPRLRGQPEPVVRATALAVLLLVLLALVPVLWTASGQRFGLALIAVLLAGACALISIRSLMPAAVLLVILSADALGVFGDHGGDNVPFIQLAAGVRLTIRDALLAGALPLAVARLINRRELPVFTRPILAVTAAIGVAFVLGFATDGDAKSPVNAMRPLFAYALYPILVAAVDTRQKFHWLLGTLVGVSVLAVAIQVVEAGRGGPLPFLALPQGAAQAQAGVSVDGKQVPYIWNRATWQLFICLFLGLGCLLEWRQVKRHGVLALVCALGFAIMLTRSWYVFIVVGVLALIAMQRNWASRLKFVGAFSLGLLTLAGVAIATAELTTRSYGGSLLSVWLTRSQTLLGFQQDSSYQARVVELGMQWHAFLASPILGYGLSAEGQRLVQIGNLDTGAINTLVMFGILGTTAFVGLLLTATWTSIQLVGRLGASVERGYAMGLVGVWAGVIVGYAFNYDLLTYPRGAWLVILALVIQDRLDHVSRVGWTKGMAY